MCHQLYEDSEFVIVKARDYIVIRKDHEYTFHSHFKTLKGAKILIKLFHEGVKPTDPYFITAMERITTDEECSRLREKKKKQRYRNRR